MLFFYFSPIPGLPSPICTRSSRSLVCSRGSAGATPKALKKGKINPGPQKSHRLRGSGAGKGLTRPPRARPLLALTARIRVKSRAGWGRRRPSSPNASGGGPLDTARSTRRQTNGVTGPKSSEVDSSRQFSLFFASPSTPLFCALNQGSSCFMKHTHLSAPRFLFLFATSSLCPCMDCTKHAPLSPLAPCLSVLLFFLVLHLFHPLLPFSRRTMPPFFQGPSSTCAP